MSIGSVTLALAISIALGGVVAVSTWAIADVLDERRDQQTVLEIALAYRDHMTASRCTLPTTALALSAVRGTLTSAGQRQPVVEEEASWWMTFDGGKNRQTAVTVYQVVTNGAIDQALTHTLPVAGGDRTHEFFDAVFDSRVCP